MAVPTMLIATAVSAAAATYGAVDSHQQQKANAKYNAKVAEANAKAAELQGRSEEEQAAENARRQQIEKRRALSAMRAQYGASGAALSSGSPLAQLGQAASDMTLASNDTLRAGVIGRSSAMTQASLFRAQGQMAKMSSPSTASLAGNITGIWANATANAAMAYSVMNPSESSPKTPPKK